MLKFLLRKPPLELEKPWRSVDFKESGMKTLMKELSEFKIGNPQVSNLRFLLYGPAGAGKSSFFNSIDGAIQGRISTRAQADAASDRSFTKQIRNYKLRKKGTGFYPIIVTDTRGLENEEEGIRVIDIFHILSGNIKDGYNLDGGEPMSEDNPKYNKSPSLTDKIHCLVAVIPATSISLMDQSVVDQMRSVRKRARDLSIPQVIIMTKVDEICPLVKKNLQTIYTSKKIKEKMEECHVRLGIPVTCIFPVKNYHQESENNTDTDILILKALLNIVRFANDHVDDQIDDE